MRIYIAGKITGDKNYKKKFAKAERALKKKGHSVMNPAWLKEYGEFAWIDYMGVSGAMQQTCEAVYFLPGWEESKGANIEHRRAMQLGQKVFFSLGDLPQGKTNIFIRSFYACRNKRRQKLGVLLR